MQISWNFRANSQILVAVFKAPDKKTQANFYISYKNDISTSYIHKISSIQLRPHNEKSFWNYTLKLALQRLFSNHHQRMCFSQWQLPSATEKQTNMECQNLLLLILLSNSRRFGLNFYREDVCAILFFANLFRHFLARESAKSIFPNIPARWLYLEKRTPKPLKTHNYLSLNSKWRLVKFWPWPPFARYFCAFALKFWF